MSKIDLGSLGLVWDGPLRNVVQLSEDKDFRFYGLTAGETGIGVVRRTEGEDKDG